MTEITTLSQRLNTRTRCFVLFTLATFGIWPLLWLYKKQDIISETTGNFIYKERFIIWLTIFFGLSQLVRVIAPESSCGHNLMGNLPGVLSGLLTTAYGVMFLAWAFKARTVLRHYVLTAFDFELKMNIFYTVIFNVSYVIYCINSMPRVLAKHQMAQGTFSRE